MNLKRSLIFGVAVGVALILPTSALAANTTSLVTGTVGTELSISAATPAVMTLTHATAGTTNQVVTVISTQASWTLSIADNNTGTNAGHMLKTAGTGSATTGSPLNLALGWGTSSGGPFNNLTGSAATVGTGSLVGTKTVYLQQALNELEQVTAGDTYSLTLNYTVS
jgi:hypothetical protein